MALRNIPKDPEGDAFKRELSDIMTRLQRVKRNSKSADVREACSRIAGQIIEIRDQLRAAGV